jgi:hypothetical protein
MERILSIFKALPFSPNILCLAVASLSFTTNYADAADPCLDVSVEVTEERKHEYAPLVVKAIGGKVKAAQVKFYSVLESGPWSAVYIGTASTDDAVLFFESANGRKQFKELWGGWADPSEKPELSKWAKNLGAPEKLARCFAATVTAGAN